MPTTEERLTPGLQGDGEQIRSFATSLGESDASRRMISGTTPMTVIPPY